MGKKADQPKAAAKASVKASAKAIAKADGAVVASAPETKASAGHLTDVQEAIKAIEMHPVLKDICSAPPLGKELDAFGLQTMKTPYSKKLFDELFVPSITCSKIERATHHNL